MHYAYATPCIMHRNNYDAILNLYSKSHNLHRKLRSDTAYFRPWSYPTQSYKKITVSNGYRYVNIAQLPQTATHNFSLRLVGSKTNLVVACISEVKVINNCGLQHFIRTSELMIIFKLLAGVIRHDIGLHSITE